MSATVDDSGYHAETLGENFAGLIAALEAAIPPQGDEFLDTSPDSLIGRTTQVFSEEFVTSQNLIATFLDLMDPQQAQAVFLDFHMRLQATRRKPATGSTIAAQLEGTPGVDVGDKRVRFTPNDSLWRTPAGLIIEANGVVQTTLTAVETGPINAVETGSTSWVIVDQVNGWGIGGGTVESTASANLGTTAESDSAGRTRLKRSSSGLGKATKPGIIKAYLEVAGVTEADINNNRKLVPDANGVPPKTIEAIIDGGDLQTLGDTALATYQGTAGTFGNTSVLASVDVELEDGSTVTVTETMLLTRVEQVAVIARYTITYGAPSEAPTDGGVAIAQATASNYINTSGRGTDVLPTASASAIEAALPVMSEPTVVGEVALKGGVLGAANIVITVRQRATIDPQAQSAIITGTQLQPFNMTVTWVLDLAVDGGTPTTVTFAVTDFEVVSAATALEVSTVIDRQVSGLNAGVDEGAVELASATSGAASSVEILGTSSASLLATLGMSVGTVNGVDTDIEIVLP